ncbi:cytochrome c oxidase assembly factor Coa1 family protein [Robertkochia solimangrovi]|uniref:cytochrome c oxidase assembly factor Coa1 family protein n=1 Tax=Robertkochia solimangrovi TaxID=2213046 RepID=UPI00117D3466|nr:cytochrome c oxidase assembly factor Coa1 family protein [Robertkochia solimangrovi]TRZ41980.1 hypothetical protein DMZ48_15195 [Robertkochia solimangrovi]
MHHTSIPSQGWFRRNWKWIIPALVTVLGVFIFFTSGLSGISGDLVQAYNDKQLYKDAMEMIARDSRIKETLGQLEPLDKMAIVEGEVNYSDDYKNVVSTVRIRGNKGSAMMDIFAELIQEEWNYSRITVRIKKPVEKQQSIEILP